MDKLFQIETYSDSPPVQYWVARDPEKGLVVSPEVRGLSSLRAKYKNYPGLGGIRGLYKTVKLDGSEDISLTAAKLHLDPAMQKLYRKKFASEHNKDHSFTIADWCDEFFCGKEIAEFVGAKPNHKFLDYWQALAVASEFWPLEKWGLDIVNPEKLIVKSATGVAVPPDLAKRVLRLARAWERGWEFRSDKDINLYAFID